MLSYLKETINTKKIIENWDNDDTDAPFKMGQEVYLAADKTKAKMKIIGVNKIEEGEYEYAVNGWCWLVWTQDLCACEEESNDVR